LTGFDGNAWAAASGTGETATSAHASAAQAEPRERRIGERRGMAAVNPR